MNTNRISRLALTSLPLAALLGAALPAQALEYGGYYRAAPAASNDDKSRACYGLNGPGLKYRLGNECDVHGEFFVSHGIEVGGVSYKGLVMGVANTPVTDIGSVDSDIDQAYVEARGFGFAPESTFWIGKRFYGRADVHIVDTKFTVMDGVGAGVMDIAAGPGKLAFSYFNEDLDGSRSGDRVNVEYYDLPVNPGGRLRLVATLADSDKPGARGGAGLTVQHNQGDFQGEGGGNSVWLQYAENGAGLDGNFASPAAGDDLKSWRLVESYHWQKGAFGGQALAMYQHDKSSLTGTTRSVSVGGRISYALGQYFKLVGEVGHSWKKPEHGDAARLTKFTFAPTLSTGPGFMTRPEIRLFVTTARWNDAAGNVTGLAALEGDTSGTSYGIQIEHWF
jgi:maltoporin